MHLIADGAPTATVLDTVALSLESLMPGARCSILLQEPGASRLRHGAAPGLPADYSRAIDGIEIGPSAGSCGTAAYHDREVVARDVLLDPRWDRFRDLAVRHGLRACWSRPIHGRDGFVGTFAVYHSEPHRPTPRERTLVERFAHLASITVDHDRLYGARQSAEAASRAKSAFVSALSHELRTPLQAITGFTELLQGLDLSPERRRAALDHIAGASRHILTLVDDVLDLARVEAGAPTIRLGDVSAGDVVRDVVELLDPLARARGVSLGHDPTDARVRADAGRLRQILLNVVGNGIRYTDPGGRVRVTTSVPSPGSVRLRVQDTGPGIPADLMDRLFVPFDRLDTDAPADPDPGPQRGFGLGLVLSRALAEAMSGRLELTSTVGRGTTVLVTLPTAAPHPADRTSPG